MKQALLSAILGLAVVAGLGAVTATAQTDEASTTGTEELTPQQRKQMAREQRVADYLQRKEEKRAQRDLARQLEARELEAQQLAEQAQAARAGAAAAMSAAATETMAGPPAGFPALPKDLAQAQAAIRKSHIARDSTVMSYLDLIDRSQASPQQLAAFGNFLAQLGTNRLALVYYNVALRLERQDPTMWVNLGTLQRQLGEFDKARSSFARALSLNPANSVAHYNLGAVMDQQGKYKQALEEYRIALTLDPKLGDPAYNPSAANNERLLAVKMMIYQENSGNVGLPMVPIEGGDIVGTLPLPDPNETRE